MLPITIPHHQIDKPLAEMLAITITAGSTPIYQQIAQQIRAACAGGELAPGMRLPTVHDLASQLGINRNTVAQAYKTLHAEGVIDSRPGRGAFVAVLPSSSAPTDDRLRGQLRSAIHAALVAGLPLPVIEATVQRTLQEHHPSVSAPLLSDKTDNLVRCMGSHDFCLDLLAHRLHAHNPRLRMVCTPVGSTAGLQAVCQGRAELAGIHLFDPQTGEYNRPIMERLFPDVQLRLITLVHREQGLIVRRGNPLGLRTIADLARPGLRFAVRQPGSGTRVLLDSMLSQSGLAFAQLAPPVRELTTHLAVAAAVAAGSADTGLGVRAAAQALDLDFIPLALERYDLAFRQADESADWLAALIEVLASPALRSEIEALAGYDASQTAWIR